MKYEPGTFTITPNKEFLRGKSPELQVIYFWICDRADKFGICWPSRSKIAEDTGIKSLTTIDKYIKVLIDMKILVKTTRRSFDSVENTSNLYQIMILESEVAQEMGYPSTLNGLPSPGDGLKLYPFNNKQLSVENPSPFIDTNNNNKDMKFTTKSEKEKLISGVYGAWIKMASTTLDIDEKDVDRSSLIRVISNAVKREEEWKLEDFKSLFKYFFADDKMAFEKKLSYSLCLSGTYISQYKLSKKGAKKQGEFKL